nr:hypothetical protein [Tanacetum cinerariifolium]
MAAGLGTARAERVAGREPVHHYRERAAQAARRGIVRKWPTTGGVGTEERRERQGYLQAGVSAAANLPKGHSTAVRVQRAAGGVGRLRGEG